MIFCICHRPSEGEQAWPGKRGALILEVTNVEGINIPDLMFKVHVLTPYKFYLKNITDNTYIDFSSSNVPGQGGTVTRMTALEFQGGLSNNATTSLSVLGPTRNRTIQIPDADGTILTTGNLGDITISAGAIKSMNISGPLFVNGNVSELLWKIFLSCYRTTSKAKFNCLLGRKYQRQNTFKGSLESRIFFFSI